MKVQKLTLRNFRNLSRVTYEPDPRLNFLVGANGQGKTTILESLGYLATLRSFRGSKTPDVVKWGEQSAEINCVVSAQDELQQSWQTELRVVFTVEGERAHKTAFINGKPFRSSTQYLTQRFGSFHLGFHTIVFNPSDHELIRGEPAIRRGYLDRVLSANDLEYLKSLQRAHRLLEQRNAVLRNAERRSPHLLEGFSEPLCKVSALIVRKRLEAISELAPRIDNVMRQITPTQAPMSLFYMSHWAPKTEGISVVIGDPTPPVFAGHAPLPSLELLEQAFRDKSAILEAAEWKAGHSLIGPHRDDWGFYLGPQLLKGHGSQGEVRATLLALKISEIDLFRKATGHRPLFLLDDFSSELDAERRRFLLNFLSETDLQVFVTTTEDSQFPGHRTRVQNGSLIGVANLGV